jgi:hypothetical protein
MQKIKERAIEIGITIGVIWFLGAIFAPVLNSIGTSSSTAPGAADAWGFVWAMQNGGYLLVGAVFIFAIGFIMYHIYKSRRG